MGSSFWRQFLPVKIFYWGENKRFGPSIFILGKNVDDWHDHQILSYAQIWISHFIPMRYGITLIFQYRIFTDGHGRDFILAQKSISFNLDSISRGQGAHSLEHQTVILIITLGDRFSIRSIRKRRVPSMYVGYSFQDLYQRLLCLLRNEFNNI